MRGKDSAQPKGLIIVVDDDAQVRRFLGILLDEAGYQVRDAEDGDLALALLDEVVQPITAIILDVTMPRRDGYSTLQELRKTRPKVPVLLSSGGHIATSSADPFLGLLPKPYSLRTLQKAITDLVAKSGPMRQQPDASMVGR